MVNSIKKTLAALLPLLLLVTISCQNDENGPKNGQLILSFEDSTEPEIEELPRFLVVTIEDQLNNKIYDRKKIELLSSGGSFLTDPDEFQPGVYSITEFFVLTEESEIQLATPKESSEFADRVNDPLPINFTVAKNKLTEVTPQVVAVNEFTSAEEFGYEIFPFEIASTISFQIAVFVPDGGDFIKTSCILSITSDGESIFNENLSAETNTIVTTDGLESYVVSVTKPGYIDYKKTFTEDELHSAFLNITLLEQKLIVYFPFNGNSNDESGNSLHGTVTGASLTTDRKGNLNSAYYFDGSSNIEVANHSLLNFTNNFTLAAWINPASFHTYGSRIIDKSVGSQGDGFLLDTYSQNLEGKRIRMMVGGTGWYFFLNTDLQQSEWCFVVVTYQSGLGKIYINGVLVKEATGNATSIIPSTTPMRFGFDTGVKTGPDYDDSFTGKLDDIRIYNRVLSAEEVANLYNE